MKKPFLKLLLVCGVFSWLLTESLPVLANSLSQESIEWSEPLPISPPEEWSWFSDIAFDPFGTLHFIWSWTRPRPNRRGLIEQIKYHRLDQDGWKNINDIIPPSADIERNALAADSFGNLHITYGGSAYGVQEIHYQKAKVDEAWSAKAWSAPFRLNQGGGYNSDIAIDSQNNIHVIFDDTVYVPNEDLDEVPLADIYYTKSTDGGENWSWPVALLYSPQTGSARPSLIIDQEDIIHVTWDEGWDRLTGNRNEFYYSLYMFSTDYGETWSHHKYIGFPDVFTTDYGEPWSYKQHVDFLDEQVVQLTVGSNNQGGVMLVWRSMERPEIFYQWLTGSGESWSIPHRVPDILARNWAFPHDIYTMITDSNGNIHLFSAGRTTLELDEPIGIYHLVWDGTTWSQPNLVFAQENLFPFYPKAIIRNGNELHLTWFTKEDNELAEDVNRVIWYSWIQLAAPLQETTPWPTPTNTPQITVVTLTPEATQTPIPDFRNIPTAANLGILQPDPYSENDELATFGLSLLPVLILLGGIIAVRLFLKKR